MTSLPVSQRRLGALAVFAAAFAVLALLAPQAGLGLDARRLPRGHLLDRASGRRADREVGLARDLLPEQRTGLRRPLHRPRSAGADPELRRRAVQAPLLRSGISALVKACGDLHAPQGPGRAAEERSIGPLRIIYSASAAMDGAPDAACPGLVAHLAPAEADLEAPWLLEALDPLTRVRPPRPRSDRGWKPRAPTRRRGASCPHRRARQSRRLRGMERPPRGSAWRPRRRACLPGSSSRAGPRR